MLMFTILARLLLCAYKVQTWGSLAPGPFTYVLKVCTFVTFLSGHHSEASSVAKNSTWLLPPVVRLGV